MKNYSKDFFANQSEIETAVKNFEAESENNFAKKGTVTCECGESSGYSLYVDGQLTGYLVLCENCAK